MDSVQFTLKLIEGRSDSSSRGRMGCRSWPMGSSMYDVHKKIGIFDHPFPLFTCVDRGRSLTPFTRVDVTDVQMPSTWNTQLSWTSYRPSGPNAKIRL